MARTTRSTTKTTRHFTHDFIRNAQGQLEAVAVPEQVDAPDWTTPTNTPAPVTEARTMIANLRDRIDLTWRAVTTIEHELHLTSLRGADRDRLDVKADELRAIANRLDAIVSQYDALRRVVDPKDWPRR